MPTLHFIDGPPPDYIAHAQIIGISELPQFLRLKSPRTAASWQNRHLLPDPDYPSINGSAAWRRLTIIRWCATTNRLPPWLEQAGAPFRVANGRRRRQASPELAHAS